MSNDLPNLSGDGMDSANTGSGQEINTIININNNDKINSSADINTHSYANYGSTEYDAGSDSDNDDGGDNSDSDDNHQTAQVEYSDLSTLFSSEVLYLPALVETEEVPFKGKKGRLKTKRVNITNDLNTIRTSSLEKEGHFFIVYGVNMQCVLSQCKEVTMALSTWYSKLREEGVVIIVVVSCYGRDWKLYRELCHDYFHPEWYVLPFQHELSLIRMNLDTCTLFSQFGIESTPTIILLRMERDTVPATVASAEGGTDGKKVRKTATRGMKARKKADSRVKRIRIRNLFKADGHKQCLQFIMTSKKEGQGARKQKKIKKEEEHVGTEKQEEESSIDKLFVSEHDKTAWEEYLRKKKDRKEKKKKKKRKRTKRMKIREGESMPQDRVVVYSNHGDLEVSSDRFVRYAEEESDKGAQDGTYKWGFGDSAPDSTTVSGTNRGPEMPHFLEKDLLQEHRLDHPPEESCCTDTGSNVVEDLFSHALVTKGEGLHEVNEETYFLSPAFKSLSYYNQDPSTGIITPSRERKRQSLKQELKAEYDAQPCLAVSGAGGQLRNLFEMVMFEEERLDATKMDHRIALQRMTAELEYPSEAKRVFDAYPERIGKKYTWQLIFAVGFAVIGAFQVGYNICVLNVPEDAIRVSLAGGTSPEDEMVSAFLWSVVVSVFALGGLIGSYTAGQVATKMNLDRRTFILYINIVLMLGVVLQMIAGGPVIMIIGRLLTGISSGAITTVVPLYLGEISPVHMRGTLGTQFQLCVVFGILCAALLGRPLGGISGRSSWRWLFALSSALALLQICFNRFLIESPRWLVSECRFQEAKDTLLRLRGYDNILFGEDFVTACVPTSIKNSMYKQASSLTHLFRTSSFSPLLLTFLLHSGQQLSGINAVFYYSASFFAGAGVEDPWIGVVLVAAVNVVGTVVAVYVIDRVGRRSIVSVSLCGMAVASIAITVYLYDRAREEQWSEYIETGSVLYNVHSANQGHPASGSFLPVAILLLFVFSFELGLGPVPWLIVNELFTKENSEMAISYAATTNWSFNFLIGLFFPLVSSYLEAYSFVPFAVVCVVVMVLLMAFLPETAGKTISEIQWELKKADERLRGRTLTETKERKDAHHHECKFALGEQTPLAGRDGRVVGGFAIRRRKGQEEAASTANGTTPLVEYRACVLSDGGDAIPVEHV